MVRCLGGSPLVALVAGPGDGLRRGAARGRPRATCSASCTCTCRAVWVAYLAFAVVLVASIVYLARRREAADRLAHASAEVGVLFLGVTIATGSIWGKPTWGTWWTWDARLTSVDDPVRHVPRLPPAARHDRGPGAGRALRRRARASSPRSTFRSCTSPSTGGGRSTSRRRSSKPGPGTMSPRHPRGPPGELRGLRAPVRLLRRASGSACCAARRRRSPDAGQLGLRGRGLRVSPRSCSAATGAAWSRREIRAAPPTRARRSPAREPDPRPRAAARRDPLMKRRSSSWAASSSPWRSAT